ncbi:hypothetical protein K450DRAFT_257418 [Umbelopsis ramanniana AG]|uniref:Cyclin-D1-binding protein 1-like N-terminal domain-containing protein n=1 Tax=Umbelopsis ramanniana AG TaxID=1314678 RepID=A0AAD5E4U2_UMBRA|nr:uncharacterized protein K450DRAFT_257418 [Umbelopsis ramanniana AG]KAI8576365.1 hypothetical protein K450DRAFT_257418 [Umbelopsis ramanniana AG]
MDKEGQETLKLLENDLQNAVQQLAVDKAVWDPNFDSIKFKAIMAGLGKILSSDATKLTLACKPPCKTSDMKPMVKGMQETVKRISGFVDTIPPTSGRTYLEHIQKLARSAFTASISLCKSLAEAEDASKIDQILKTTGSVWDVCKSFESQVASNNREAVEKQWKGVSEMVADAQEELQDFIAEQNADDNEEEEEDDGWGDIMENGTKMTPEQLEACKKTFNMIKMTSMVLKKVQLRFIATASNDAETNIWLDDLSRAGSTVSDQIDIVASSFYEEDANLKDYIASFVASALSLITIVETRVKEDEHVRWFQVSKAQAIGTGGGG